MKTINAIFSQAFVFAALALTTYAADGERVGHVKHLYGFTNWHGTKMTNYTSTVTNWSPNFMNLGITQLLRSVRRVLNNGGIDSFYILKPKDHQASTLYVEVGERQNLNDAQLAMMESFSERSGIQPFRIGATNGLGLGDRCYFVGPVSAPLGVDFVRNNLFISVLQPGASTNNITLDVAQELDRQALDSQKVRQDK